MRADRCVTSSVDPGTNLRKIDNVRAGIMKHCSGKLPSKHSQITFESSIDDVDDVALHSII